MLNDKQSLILCGILAVGFFVSGLLEFLDNYIVKTVLTLIFLVILTNAFIVYNKRKKEEQNNLK